MKQKGSPTTCGFDWTCDEDESPCNVRCATSSRLTSFQQPSATATMLRWFKFNGNQATAACCCHFGRAARSCASGVASEKERTIYRHSEKVSTKAFLRLESLVMRAQILDMGQNTRRRVPQVLVRCPLPLRLQKVDPLPQTD